jgi:hypothetical protein
MPKLDVMLVGNPAPDRGPMARGAVLLEIRGAALAEAARL